jgi:hypothetical protein
MVIQNKCYQTVLDDLGRFVGYRTTLSVPKQFVFDTYDYYLNIGRSHFVEIKTPKMKSSKYVYAKMYQDFNIMWEDIKYLQIDVNRWKEKQLQEKRKILINSLKQKT